MGLTDKQKSILLKNGWTEEDIDNAPYEDASNAIGEILSKPKPKYTPKAVEKPVFKKAETLDKKSFYVAYCKDLVVAGKTPDEALTIIKQFRQAFE